MRRKSFSFLSIVTITCFALTGCGEKDIKGESGKRSFSTDFLSEQIRMVDIRGYDGMTYNSKHTFSGCYRLDGTNDRELQFSDNMNNYVISTNKNLKDRPKSLKIYYDANNTKADTYSISKLSSC